MKKLQLFITKVDSAFCSKFVLRVQYNIFYIHVKLHEKFINHNSQIFFSITD